MCGWIERPNWFTDWKEEIKMPTLNDWKNEREWNRKTEKPIPFGSASNSAYACVSAMHSLWPDDWRQCHRMYTPFFDCSLCLWYRLRLVPRASFVTTKGKWNRKIETTKKNTERKTSKTFNIEMKMRQKSKPIETKKEKTQSTTEK